VTFAAATDDFATTIAPARTYGFQYEIEYLWKNNKALGATSENAIVVNDTGYSLPLRFPDEIARHKILDFIGDIANLGRVPLGEFFVFKSGHGFNAELVRRLA
jgi:UDP-3-O-[3-hydroxymyristoyl] N-acetylglucosamine deacetylase